MQRSKEAIEAGAATKNETAEMYMIVGSFSEYITGLTAYILHVSTRTEKEPCLLEEAFFGAKRPFGGRAHDNCLGPV